MRSYHNFEMKPIDMICNFNIKWNPSLNALPPGDTDSKGPHHLVIQKRHSSGIIVETVRRMNEENKGIGNGLLFSEGKYHCNLSENQR